MGGRFFFLFQNLKIQRFKNFSLCALCLCGKTSVGKQGKRTENKGGSKTPHPWEGVGGGVPLRFLLEELFSPCSRFPAKIMTGNRRRLMQNVPRTDASTAKYRITVRFSRYRRIVRRRPNRYGRHSHVEK